MQAKIRTDREVSVLPRCKKRRITKRFLDRLATGVLVLVLALGAILSAIWAASWWDNTPVTSSVSALTCESKNRLFL